MEWFNDEKKSFVSGSWLPRRGVQSDAKRDQDCDKKEKGITCREAIADSERDGRKKW